MHDVHVNLSSMGSRANIGWVPRVRWILKATATLKSAPLFVGEIAQYPCFITTIETSGPAVRRLPSGYFCVGVFGTLLTLEREHEFKPICQSPSSSSMLYRSNIWFSTTEVSQQVIISECKLCIVAGFCSRNYLLGRPLPLQSRLTVSFLTWPHWRLPQNSSAVHLH